MVGELRQRRLVRDGSAAGGGHHTDWWCGLVRADRGRISVGESYLWRTRVLDNTHCVGDHNTSQMLRTMGLLPSCAGLRGSTVSFSGVRCFRGSLQV